MVRFEANFELASSFFFLSIFFSISSTIVIKVLTIKWVKMITIVNDDSNC